MPQAFRPAPFNPKLEIEDLRQMSQVINEVQKGKTNNVNTITLTVSVTTTTITDSRISIQSVISLMPTTANSAAAVTTTFIVPTTGSATITHANNAQADRTFFYSVVG